MQFRCQKYLSDDAAQAAFRSPFDPRPHKTIGANKAAVSNNAGIGLNVQWCSENHYELTIDFL